MEQENHSSESDEDTNVRHDRFRSERFKDSSSSRHNLSSSKARESSYNKSSSKKYRERSPVRSHTRKSETPQRKESRTKYDDKRYHSKSKKYEKRGVTCQLPTRIEKKHSDEPSDSRERDESNSSKTSSKKLSSLLMNFDKKIESKRLNSESNYQVGPSLPPHLAHKVEVKEELISMGPPINTSIGPALPPLLKPSNKNTNDETDNDPVINQPSNLVETEIKSDSSCESIDQSSECDTLSSMGPALPPHLQSQQIKSIKDSGPEESLQANNVQSSPVNESDEKSEVYGPVLPPKLEEDSYGPALPPNFKKHAVQGPTLPSGMTSDDLERMGEEESEDEDTFGPLPLGKMTLTQYQLDLRALDIKRKLEEEKSGSSKDIKKREEWMLELPPEKASNLGLGPRSFRMKAGPDMSNRSAWTDTPAEKKRKEEMALRGEAEPVNSEEVMRAAFVIERNETMDKISKLSRDKDRKDSLLESHQKKLKKKKKKEEKEGKKKERRPFDRNIDLQVHRFDEAQKKAIFKKAQLLDTRFSSGESKYL